MKLVEEIWTQRGSDCVGGEEEGARSFFALLNKLAALKAIGMKETKV